SMSFMARTIFNGAGHAATENKKYVNGTNEGQIKLAQTSAGMNWKDDDAFQGNLDTIRHNAEAVAIGKGWSKPQADAYTEDQVAHAWIDRTKVRAITDPFGAREMYNQHKSEYGAYRPQVEAMLESREAAVGSKEITNQIS